MSFRERLEFMRLVYPVLGVGFVATALAIPYFFSKAEDSTQKLSAKTEEARQRRAELWSKASPRARLMSETNQDRLAVLFEDVKSGNLDRHYHAAMRGKIYSGMNPRSTSYAGVGYKKD